jgi:cytochrome P450
MGLPPGPRLPAAAQAALYMARPFELLDRCSRRYGDLFTLRFPVFGTMVCASRPEAIKEIFTGDPDALRVGEGNEPFRPLVGDSSILLLDGDPHRLHRRLFAPLFYADRAGEHTDTIRDVTLRALSRWPIGERIAMHPELQAITLDVILRTVLGMDEGAPLTHVRDALGGLLRANTSWFASLLLVPPLQRDLGPLTPWAGFRRGMDRVDALVYAHIARRRAEGGTDRGDVLSRMLRVSEAEGASMTDVELRDALMTLVVAGHETTATSLCWALEAVLSHPDVLARIRAELREVTGGAPLTTEHASRLVYLDATIKEVLRLYPVVPIIGMGRKLAAPTRFEGHDLPVGVKIVPAVYATHRRAELYPEPGRFQPERFLDDKIDPYAWLPFGGGVRRCLGLPFALHELRVVLATLLLRADLRLVRRGPLRATVHGVTIAPEGGTHVLVERVLPWGAAA